MLRAGPAPSELGRSTLYALAVAGIAALFAARGGTAHLTTYAGASAMAAAVDLAAGFGLLAAGAISLATRSTKATGTLATLAGFAWLAADWVGWQHAPAIARSVAMVLVPFMVPLLVHLSLVQPSGRSLRRWSRRSVVVAYGVTGLIAAATAVVRDPFLDEHCWSNCRDNTFLVRSQEDTATLLVAIGLWSAAIIAALGVVACGVRLTRATAVARRMMFPIVVPAGLALVAMAVQAAVLLAVPGEDPERDVFMTLFLVRGVTMIALAVGVGVVALRGWRTGRRVSVLADALGAAPPPGSLGSALAASLGDEDLEVAYWLPSSQRYVDSRGRTVDPAPGAGQASTAIVRAGEPIALVIHDDALSPAREVGAAARLAVDNERLRAEVMAQLGDLRASRSRIVEYADATRRRLERDVHDVAQQRLLAASFELRLAHADAASADAEPLQERLAHAADATQRALVELRELAHGVFPAILTEAGLEPALRTLATRAPLAVELIGVVDRRCSLATETAAYFVVAAGIDLANARSATVVHVRVGVDGDTLVVAVDDDGSESIADMTHIADRVGALGGTLTTEPRALVAELPCAS